MAVSAPVLAQDVPFSIEATESCLEAGRGEACIGEAAGQCMDTPDGYTTVGMGACLGRELDWWDARLNAAYGRLMEIEKAADAEMKEIGATAPEMATALRAMQRAWIPYRDALCDYERSQWGGGTGQGPATAACLMTETGRQALWLERRLEDREGQ